MAASLSTTWTRVLFILGMCATLPALYGCSRDNLSRIRVGGIFDTDVEEIRSAFKYQHMNHNGELKVNIKIDSNPQRIDTKDSFSLITTMCSLMGNGVYLLYTTPNIRTLNTLRSYANTFHMPFVTPSMAVNVSGQNQEFGIYMRPLYTKAILAIIKQYEWTRIFYLYSSDEGLMRLQQLYDTLGEDGYQLSIKVYRVKDALDAWNTLLRLDLLYEGENKHILLDMPNDMAEALLKEQKIDARRVRFHYFITGLGIQELNLEDYANGGINMTGFQMVDFSSNRNFFSRWSGLDPSTWLGAGVNKITYEAALTIDAVNVILAAFESLLQENSDYFQDVWKHGRFMNNGTEGINCDAESVRPWKHGKAILEAIRNTRIDGLTGIVTFDEFGLRKHYEFNVMETNINRGLAKIGKYSRHRKLEIMQPTIVRNKGNNTFANKTRTVTSILTSPYLMRRSPTGSGLDREDPNTEYEGFCADLAKKVADHVKFKYIIVPVRDDKYGSWNDTSHTWNGMIGELVRKEADLAIAPLTITSAREKVIDFSKPFMSLGISIMIKKQAKEIPGVFSFMYPLSYEIWMCVIFAYIGVSVVLFLVSRFSPFEWHIEDNTDGPSVNNNFTIFNSLWFSLGAFMQQGCDIEPRSMSGRIVGSVWWFFTLIIISSYTANLAAFLTVERMQSPIQSAEDLASQTEIKYGTVDSGSTKDFFRTSSIAVYERMWAFMSSAEPSVFVDSNEAGVERVRSSNGRYAFLTESTTNDYTNQRKPCDTMKVGNNLDSKGYGIGTPLGSDLRDHVTLAVLELREKGELQKLQKKWWYDRGECGTEATNPKKDATSALKLNNVAGIFYILLGGVMLALIMAALEFLYKSKVEARRRKTTFSNAVRSKARLSFKGKPEHNTTATYPLMVEAHQITVPLR